MLKTKCLPADAMRSASYLIKNNDAKTDQTFSNAPTNDKTHLIAPYLDFFANRKDICHRSKIA